MRTDPIRVWLLAGALLPALVLSACAAGVGTSSPSEAPADLSPAAETPQPVTPTADISEAGLAALVERAAEEAGVDIGEVRVITAEEVTWSDGSLGCPRAGQAYIQALVPGFRVVLEIGGGELNFHAAQGGQFTFCEDPQPPVDGR